MNNFLYRLRNEGVNLNFIIMKQMENQMDVVMNPKTRMEMFPISVFYYMGHLKWLRNSTVQYAKLEPSGMALFMRLQIPRAKNLI